jgi:ketosteroid isomerase-like protein
MYLQGAAKRARIAPRTPAALTREFVNRANAGDAEGLADLYVDDAVMAFPPGQITQGREALIDLFEKLICIDPHFDFEDPGTTVEYHGELALCSTKALGGIGARVQVAQRQADGTWKRLIDNPYPGKLIIRVEAPAESRSSAA